MLFGLPTHLPLLLPPLPGVLPSPTPLLSLIKDLALAVADVRKDREAAHASLSLLATWAKSVRETFLGLGGAGGQAGQTALPVPADLLTQVRGRQAGGTTGLSWGGRQGGLLGR